MGKIDLKREVDELVKRQREESGGESISVLSVHHGLGCKACLQDPRRLEDCMIPTFAGLGHDKIIGWSRCPNFERRKRLHKESDV